MPPPQKVSLPPEEQLPLYFYGAPQARGSGLPGKWDHCLFQIYEYEHDFKKIPTVLVRCAYFNVVGEAVDMRETKVDTKLLLEYWSQHKRHCQVMLEDQGEGSIDNLPVPNILPDWPYAQHFPQLLAERAEPLTGVVSFLAAHLHNALKGRVADASPVQGCSSRDGGRYSTRRKSTT